jgi:hypothetical protein
MTLHFNIRVIKPGERYGRNDALTNDSDDSLVEFYDARYPHTPHGQFVSRYYLTTFMEINGQGLRLDGGVPDWSLSIAQVAAVQRTLREYQAGGA